MNYRRIWEEYNNRKIPDGFEIHHIDGNNKNNKPENLLCVSIEEHLEIHKKQKDYGAVQAILMRLENREGISKAASAAQKERLRRGDHNFQKMTKERRTEISKKTIENRIKDGNSAFLGIENVKENARKAGNVAKEKNAGFLNTNSDKHGSRYVRNTHWWVNEKNERIRSKEKPKGEWKRGMKYNES